jgi:SagB-type dehydrogenase family enzyme
MIPVTINLNPFLFFLIREGGIVAWDYKNHQQYELEEEYFLRLLELSNGFDDNWTHVDDKLKEAEFVSTSFEDVKWDWDVLSKIFHFGTKIRECDLSLSMVENPECYVEEHIALAKSFLTTSPDLLTEKEGEIFSLPPPSLSKLNATKFLQVLQNRKTSRSFDNIPIEIETLSTLLHIVFGNFHPEQDDYSKYGFRQVGLRKTSPSAGGLHPSEAYVLAFNVNGLESGIYHYQAHKHVLSYIQKEDLSLKMTKLLCGQYFAEKLSFGIFITSRFDKIWHKYPHSRAYRVALLDVGHLSQTFQLTATALGLNTWLSGVFLDAEVSRLLQIDDATEQPLFFVGAGIGDNSPLDPIAKKMGSK